MHCRGLFAEVYPALLRYAHRLTGDSDVSEDVAQEAFVRLVERRVEGTDQELRLWLFRVATNLLRDRGRMARTRRRLTRENAGPSEEAPYADDDAERAERIRIVRGALDSLDARGKKLLLMREEGFSHREMAGATGVATGSVGTLLARARKKFAAELETRGYRHDSFF